MMGRSLSWALVAGMAFMVAGCDGGKAPTPAPTVEPSAVASGDPQRSIFRPGYQDKEAVEQTLEPLNATIGFPEGDALDGKAVEALVALMESEQIKLGGAITLRGHSDAGGNDAANLRISLRRAEAVRDWLVGKGVDAARISVIAFGEQNPIADNALPDGSPDETGRASNRRVDIHVAGGTGASAGDKKQTLAETLANPDATASDQAKPPQ